MLKADPPEDLLAMISAQRLPVHCLSTIAALTAGS